MLSAFLLRITLDRILGSIAFVLFLTVVIVVSFPSCGRLCEFICSRQHDPSVLLGLLTIGRSAYVYS